MDTRELVDRVTSEVLTRLKESPRPGVLGAPAGPVAPGSSGRGLAAPVPAAGGSRAARGGEGRAAGAAPVTRAEVARFIDHTLLKPEATREQVDRLCAEAAEHGFYSVCVNATWVAHCARRLRGTPVKVCCVVGFPLGAMDSRSKAFEARGAIENGAAEIDMVINVGALKSGDLRAVEEDIRAVRRACRQNTVLKVIMENALLTDAEKVLGCQIAKKAEADFVKTSTGFSSSGATPQDVALMRRTVGPEMGVKAAGGVRSYEDALAMIAAGATRIGASSSVAIVTGGESRSNY